MTVTARARPGFVIPGAVLRPLRDDDEAALTHLLHDKDVRRYMCDDRILPPEFIAGILRNDRLDAEDGLGRWMIEAEHGGVFGLAGLCRVRNAGGNAPYRAGEVEAVIALYPRLWGQGLAAAALRALIAHARDALRLDRLIAVADRRKRAFARLAAPPRLCSRRHHARPRARIVDPCSRMGRRTA